MVRYADDLVLLSPPGKGPKSESSGSRLTAARACAQRAKTRIVQSPPGGLVFLGFTFRWHAIADGKCISPMLEPRR